MAGASLASLPMPPSRFSNVSPFKNVQANVAKKESWFGELPLASTSAPESSNGIKATDEYAIARGSGVGSFVFLQHGKTGKYGQKAPTWNASGRAITDFDTSYTETLVAAASEDGQINIARLPESIAEGELSLALGSHNSLHAPAQKAIDVVQFHPSASGLLLAAQGASVQVWDVQRSQAVHTVTGCEKGNWSTSWSYDGKLLQTAGKDNVLSLWDVRSSSDKAVSSTPGHQGFNKASRIVSLNDLIFTTGFTKTRERECSLWDPRNFAKPLTSTRLDTNTGVLMPLVDHARKIVYLAGRSDMSLRWIEVTSNGSLTQGVTALPAACLGAAIVPSTSSTLDVMQAEIAKLVVLTQDSVIPITMQVPRRNYLDFHHELFPASSVYQQPAQDAQSWLDGQDDYLEMVVPQPGTTWGKGGGSATKKQANTAPPPSTSKPVQNPSSRVPSESPKTVTPTPATTESYEAHKITQPSADSVTSRLEKATISEQSAAPREASKSLRDNKPNMPPVTPSAQAPVSGIAHQAAEPAPATSVSAVTRAPEPRASLTTQATHWSRTFLAGKTALKPEYEDIHGVASTMSASVQLLKANQDYFFYPLSGPGGRIAVHPVSAQGRLPTHAPTLAAGSDVVDFAMDPFNSKRVYVACNDAKIRVFDVPEKLEGDHGEAVAVLDDGMDKVLELQPHPAVASLLLSVSEDHGEGVIRVWDSSAGQVLSKSIVPGKGVHSAAWDALGTRIAVTCKDKKVRVLDPRNSSSDAIVVGPSHDSVRPSRATWVDDSYLITCGFSRTAFREIAIHEIAGKEMKIVGRTNIDVSPAPLFPHYDADTNVLFAYSKGERTCHAYEVNLADKSKNFAKLPSFEHGTLQSAFAFLPKQTVDVKKVEIAHAYRLTPNSIQYISFTIPRAKMDYFQDDIFSPTLEKLAPSLLTPKEWAEGKNAEARYIDLQPEGMQQLSQAPPPPARTKQQVMKKQMTEEEASQQYLDSLFKNKQAEVDSDEDEARVKQRNEADDDDW